MNRARTDITPSTWEIPCAAAACWLLLAAVILPAGQAIATLLWHGAFTWPHGGPALKASILGLLGGHPGDGLSPAQAHHIPSRVVVYSLISIGETLWCVLSVAGLRVWWTSSGPGAIPGMAHRADVRAVLGLANLHRRRSVLRPDLPTGRHAVDLWKKGEKLFAPSDAGWLLGRSSTPRGIDLWVPFDRTTGVYGAQGSGKTLDLLTPALLAAPGAALVTLTKLDDLLLTYEHRKSGGRPVAVLDPFGIAPGLTGLVWDPVAGCVDSMVAERRAKAFTAGTVRGAVTGGTGDDSARFYAAEAAKVLQAFLHAAALTDRTLEHVLQWVADPAHAYEPEEILRTHAGAAPFWDGLLRGALHGDSRTAGNTATTVQQALALFFQEPIRRRCVPTADNPATDLTHLIQHGGTIYLLGRDDPYASASPLMTAVAEHILDLTIDLAFASEHGRLCPPFLACLDELPSTAPLPTLRTRMANERDLGISFLYAAQTWRQLLICYGEDEARALFGLTNNITIFGGGKDPQFYREISDLLGTTRIRRTTYNHSKDNTGRSISGEDTPILRPEEIRQLRERHALIVAENAPPLIARLHRSIDGPRGRQLLTLQEKTRRHVARSRQVDARAVSRSTGTPSQAPGNSGRRAPKLSAFDE